MHDASHPLFVPFCTFVCAFTHKRVDLGHHVEQSKITDLVLLNVHHQDACQAISLPPPPANPHGSRTPAQILKAHLQIETKAQAFAGLTPCCYPTPSSSSISPIKTRWKNNPMTYPNETFAHSVGILLPVPDPPLLCPFQVNPQ